ncbi:methionyl-tRNA formyltransferase [Candidatus Uhrbacteria bacterium]|nr:methionyl-tRNA formyltransferase [Candidatus Uhrbacteria bacterium]
MAGTYKFDTLTVVYFGTPEVSTYGLQALIDDERFEVKAVVTQPPKPVGRKQVVTKSPIHDLAEANSIKVLTPMKAADAMDELAEIDAELHIVVAYGQILPNDLVELPPYGTLNIHPSLLPLHRGAAPVPAAILAGDKETGVCIMLMDDKMDHGPILDVQRLTIGRKTTAELLPELMKMGADHLPNFANEWAKERMTPKTQDHDLATFCKMMSRENARINWEAPIDEIERMVRAYDPWPGTWTEVEIDGVWKRLKILKAHLGDAGSDISLKTSSEGTRIGVLVIDALQIEGKNVQSGVEFAKTRKDQSWQVR